MKEKKFANKRLVFTPDGRSDSRRDAAPAAQAWRYVNPNNINQSVELIFKEKNHGYHFICTRKIRS
jgi:hypothetical protein